jgi:hypothetical protein
MLSQTQELKIKNLDLVYLEKRLVDRNRWSEEEAKETVRRYKNFLLLLLKYPDETLAPAPDIDEAWHNHILFTREYMRDSEAIFGSYLHHTPSQEGEEEKLVMKEAQRLSADLYIREFNEPYLLELDIAEFW